MKVTAKRTKLTEGQRRALGGPFVSRDPGGPRRVGEQRTVLGLLFAHDSRQLGTGTWVIYQDDLGSPVQAPLDYFDVSDARPSRLWRYRDVNESVRALWPDVFNEPHFLEDAAEPRSAERRKVDAIRQEIEQEHEGVPTT